MKRIYYLSSVLLLLSAKVSISQTPFSTTVKEPRFLTRPAASTTDVYTAVEDSATLSQYFSNTLAAGTQVIESVKDDADFFKNNGLALNLVNKGENRASVNAQVLHYKLYVANPSSSNTTRINRYNIPLMIISKLSSSYDSVNASSSLDVLDYEAAPLTVRVMPSFRATSTGLNDILYWGFYADARGINIYNDSSKENDLNFIGSGGVGLTLQGDGRAGLYNSDGEYANGRYSLSVMLQGAFGKDVIQKLFRTEKDYVGSLQGYLVFRISESNALNLKFGYQQFFQRTVAGSKSNFSLSLGI